MATIFYAFPNGIGVPIFPFRNMPDYDVSTGVMNLTTPGDLAVLIGRINLQGGFEGGSKTISTAGGKIHCRLTSTVWANAGTVCRIGLQDMTAAGNPDGSYDAHFDVQATVDAIGSSSTVVGFPVESGSKTLTHGDYVALCFEMITLGGSDRLTVQGMSQSSQITPDQIPYSILNGARDRIVPYACLTFDDGTIGWFSTNVFGIISNQAFNQTSTAADEYGSMFKLPFACKVQRVMVSMQVPSSLASFEVVLYNDPLGTPTVIDAVTFDAAKLYNSTTRGIDVPLNSLIELQQNINYGLTVRALNSTNSSLEIVNFGSEALKGQTELGIDWSLINRLDNSGPFTLDTTRVAHVGLFATEIGLVGDTVSLFT